jgi:hypothetical protein
MPEKNNHRRSYSMSRKPVSYVSYGQAKNPAVTNVNITIGLVTDTPIGGVTVTNSMARNQPTQKP